MILQKKGSIYMEIIMTKVILLLGKALMTAMIVLTVIDSYETNRMVKEYLENMKADEISQKSAEMEGE